MKKYVIRPCGAGNALFVFWGILVLLCSCFFSISFLLALLLSSGKMELTGFLSELLPGDDIFKTVAVVLCSPLVGWMGVLLLNMAFRPCITLFEERLEIKHWKNGTPYSRNMPFLQQWKLAKTITGIVEYKDLLEYGAFFGKDIKKRRGKGDEFYVARWSTPVRGKRRLNRGYSLHGIGAVLSVGLRNVLLFEKASGERAVFDVELYGLGQIEGLLYEIEARTKIPPKGRILPKRRINSYPLNIIRAFGVFCWILLPIATPWAERMINPLHAPPYESGWQTIYVLCFFVANFCSAAFVGALKQWYDNDVRRLGKIFGIAMGVLYAIAAVAFTVSVLRVG